jgi:proteasome lid subunit RPN8/RPN11
MRRLWLTPDLAKQIAQHGLEDYPREACGLIGGAGERALSITRVANISPNAEHAFEMDGAGFINAVYALNRRDEALIGIYHTHPHGDHLPSPVDVQEAQYPDTAYVVVGLKNRRPQLSAWNIKHSMVEPVELIISEVEPEPAPRPLSQAEQRLVVIAMILAFIFVIVLALSLLPPAPPIPTR